MARWRGRRGCPAGRALRESPKEMKLPWHRVVGAGGKIVFPRTSLNFREQARRLRAEGVVVKEGRVSREAIRDLESCWGASRVHLSCRSQPATLERSICRRGLPLLCET